MFSAAVTFLPIFSPSLLRDNGHTTFCKVKVPPDNLIHLMYCRMITTVVSASTFVTSHNPISFLW